MTQGFGYNEFALIGKETTWGTAAGTFPVTVELIEDALAAIREKAFSASFRGRTKRHVIRAKEGAAGAIGVELAYTGMGGLLHHLFGNISSTGPTDVTAFTHVFTLADALQVGITVQVNRDVIAAAEKGFQYVGCRVNSATFSLETDGFLGLSLDLIAKDEATNVAMSAGTFPDDFITFDQLTSFKINAVDEKAKIKSVELTIGNGLDGDRRSIGDHNILEALPGDHREITGTIEMWFEDQTEYDDFIAGTERAIEILLEGAIIAGSTTKRSLKIEIPRVVFTGETPNVDTAGALSQTLAFEAIYDKTNSKDAVTVTLINETAIAAPILL